jgi:hypothetical protein
MHDARKQSGFLGKMWNKYVSLLALLCIVLYSVMR